MVKVVAIQRGSDEGQDFQKAVAAAQQMHCYWGEVRESSRMRVMDLIWSAGLDRIRVIVEAPGTSNRARWPTSVRGSKVGRQVIFHERPGSFSKRSWRGVDARGSERCASLRELFQGYFFKAAIHTGLKLQVEHE